jgi:hypothetical protein
MSDPERTFRYHDGNAEVHGDPAALRRGLVLATGGRVNQLLRDYYAANDARARGLPDEALAAAEVREARAAAVLLPAVREVFSLKPFDGGTGRGATDDDCDRVLCEFQNYLAGLKKKPVTSPSTAPPTAPTSLADHFSPKSALGSR